MPGVSKILHKDKEIMFINYQGVNDDLEMVEILTEAYLLIVKENKPIYQLVNFKGAYATPYFMQEAKKIAKKTPDLVIKAAIIGIDSIARKILLKGYNLVATKMLLKPFNTIEEAKDWLVL